MTVPINQNLYSWLTAPKISNIPANAMANDEFQRTRFRFSVYCSRGAVPTALYVIHHFLLSKHEAPTAGQQGVSPGFGGSWRRGLACGGDLRVSRATKVQNAMHQHKVVGLIDKEKATF
jgi:hypothetical protein